jgi:hypothetical protein
MEIQTLFNVDESVLLAAEKKRLIIVGRVGEDSIDHLEPCTKQAPPACGNVLSAFRDILRGSSYRFVSAKKDGT